ncbi:MAG: stage II sporulation protein P [Desulfotomaculum sp.]|nr:stage II sporulation protein P [Desulfotomaculum sp.]
MLLLAGLIFFIKPVNTSCYISSGGHEAGKNCRVKDGNGSIITELACQVFIGDEILLPDGRLYRVNEVKENAANADFKGIDKDYIHWLKYYKKAAVQTTTRQWKKRPVGIYHTHTDESYLPESGKAIEPFQGDIYQVGQHFADYLRSVGVNVLYYKTPHDPHDNNAYIRSRRTAAGILKNNPAALFDIHRDGVPSSSKYRVKIDGRMVAKVRLVIGKQNPRYPSNKDFAKRLMAYAHQLYPGLIKDLYMGSGSYNQDLLSTAVLVEAGTYTNTLEEALKGITLFAEAVPPVLGLTAGVGPGEVAIEEHSRSSWAVAGWLFIITLMSAAAFYFISRGNFEKTVETAALTIRKKMSSPEIMSIKKSIASAAVKIKHQVVDFLKPVIKWQAFQKLFNYLQAAFIQVNTKINQHPALKPMAKRKVPVKKKRGRARDKQNE